MSYCSDITKNRILECAKKEFLNKGFDKAQVGEIAKAANVTTGAIYRHFKNKEDLFFTLIEDVYKYTLEVVVEVETKNESEDYKTLLAQDEHIVIEAMFSEAMNFVNYMYEHFEEFKLIFECSKGSMVEKFVEEIVNRYTKKNMRLIHSSGNKKLGIDKIEEFEVYMLTRGYIISLCECIIHNIPHNYANRYIKSIVAFQYYGWNGLLNFNTRK